MNTKTQHPYEGLSDQRGSLTRYPAEVCTLPYHWVKEYTELGGGFDSMGVYGIRPNETIQDFSPAFICKLLTQADGRWDRIPSLYLINEWGIPIHETANLEHLRVFEKAIKFIAECSNEFGFHPIYDLHRSPFFCARMHAEKNVNKRIKFQFLNGRRVSKYVCKQYEVNPSLYDQVVASVNKKLYRDLVKGAYRISLKEKVKYDSLEKETMKSIPFNFPFYNKKDNKILNTKEKFLSFANNMHIYGSFLRSKSFSCPDKNGEIKFYEIFYMPNVPYILVRDKQTMMDKIITPEPDDEGFYSVRIQGRILKWENDFSHYFVHIPKEVVDKI